jgi:BASS family bile acid:Na+ symporter
MNVVFPLLVALLVMTFGLRPPVEIALIALAVSPVPPFLPGKQLKLASTEGFTIGLFAATALLAPILVTATMALVERLGVGGAHVRVGAIASIVIGTVLLPLVLGVLVRSLWPRGAARVQSTITIVAVVMLVAALVPVLISQWPAIRSLLGDGTLAAIVAATLLGLAVGHLLGGPQSDDRTVLALATASRHPAVAVAVAAASFPDEKLVPPAVLLALLTTALATTPYVVWRKRIHRDLGGGSPTGAPTHVPH